MKEIKSILVANRSEIAIRVLRGASELGLRTVAIFSNEDRFALHRFKADESYLVGAGKKPLQAYLDIDDIIRIAKENDVDAIHPGYGFLSENPEFADACAKAGIAFIGPKGAVMRTLGNKVAAREVAIKAGVPVVPATGALPGDIEEVKRMAAEIGYPLMLKASWGGGGRGMRAIETEADLAPMIDVARREAAAAFGNDEVYLEKLIRRARHVEVQVLGDPARQPGAPVRARLLGAAAQPEGSNVPRRPTMDETKRTELCESALRPGARSKLLPRRHGGIPLRRRHGQFYFIEVNPRIQVEHTVTEEVTGVDIVKAQIRVTEGSASALTTCCPARTRSPSTATPCSAGSPPKTRRTTSPPTTARSRCIAPPPAAASAWMRARPIRAPSSPRTTTPCW
ncbi:ATP-binding protein [Nitrogeniibacter aestuarii]|nr:biotin carboxylase N-terminal domain-containing protein [Nitrogeniibacter aestuarii]